MNHECIRSSLKPHKNIFEWEELTTFKIIVLLTALEMDFNQRHRRPVEDKSPSSVYNQRQTGRNQDSDFRKQIHSRDEEIFLLSQTNDHLRQRLDQTVT